VRPIVLNSSKDEKPLFLRLSRALRVRMENIVEG
jgi:hypothetical protein